MTLRLSPSKLSDFDNCARQFFYRHVERHTQQPRVEMVVGSVWHAAIAAVLEDGSLGNLEHRVNEAVSEHRGELEEFYESEKIDDGFWTEVYRGVTRLWDEVLCFIEPEILEDRYFDEQWNFAGVVDCVSKCALTSNDKGAATGAVAEERQVLDWKIKTSLKRRRTDRDARVSAQLAAYALRHGVRRAAFVEIPRNPEAPILVRTTSYTDAELDHWRRWFDGRLSTIRSLTHIDQYAMTSRDNPLCSALFCDFYGKCYGKEGK